jgi:hypothetical protein
VGKHLLDALARVEPDGTVTEFEVTDPLAGGIAVDSNDDVWFTMSTGFASRQLRRPANGMERRHLTATGHARLLLHGGDSRAFTASNAHWGL